MIICSEAEKTTLIAFSMLTKKHINYPLSTNSNIVSGSYVSFGSPIEHLICWLPLCHFERSGFLASERKAVLLSLEDLYPEVYAEWVNQFVENQVEINNKL